MKVTTTRIGRRGFLVGAAALGVARPAIAQQYPNQDIHLVCGFAAGSGADVIVRFMGEKMKALSGRAVIVENKPGALGNIATEYVARSKPDGYTVYVTGGPGLAANMHIVRNPPVDVGKALQVVATINRQPVMFVVRADSPHASIADLTAAMNAKGDSASYAIANTPSKVAGAMYREKTGLKAQEVSYKTGAEFLNDLASGAIDFAIPDNAMAVAQARNGRMKILAVSTGERMKSVPQYPTMTESGVPMDIRAWWAGFVPAGTPRQVVDQLNVWISQIVSSEEGRNFFAGIAADSWASAPEEGQTYFLDQIRQWGEYVKLAKIEPQG